MSVWTKAGSRWAWGAAAAVAAAWAAYYVLSVWFARQYHGCDGSVFYLAGRAWWDGQSPYDRATFARYYVEWSGGSAGLERAIFVTPPTIAPYALLTALLPWSQARPLQDLIELMGWAAVVAGALAVLRAARPDALHRPFTWVCIAAAGFVGGVQATLLFGQLAIFAVAGALGAVLAWRAQRPVLGALCICLASFKPQVSALLLLYLLCRGCLRPFVYAAVVALGLTALLERGAGLAGLPGRLVQSLHAYGQLDFNAALSNRVGLMGFFPDAYSGVAIGGCAAVGALVAAALARLHARAGGATATFGARWDLHVFVCLVASALLLPIFSYDMVGFAVCLMLVPLFDGVAARGLLLVALAASAKPNGLAEVLARHGATIPGPGGSVNRQVLVVAAGLIILAVLALERPWRAAAVSPATEGIVPPAPRSEHG